MITLIPSGSNMLGLLIPDSSSIFEELKVPAAKMTSFFLRDDNTVRNDGITFLVEDNLLH